MKKFKLLIGILGLLLFTGSVLAQSLEEGKKFLYYERNQSAYDIFQKLMTANPKDEMAVYYAGQALIGLERDAEAKALYLKKLSEMPNSALLLAGVGHVELHEGKTAEARNHFETAISISQGKSLDVLNAVGLANVDAKAGDARYAIAKLTQATQFKKMNNPEVWTNLGDAYRKIADGSNAIRAYNEALRLNPNYARAIYRSGKVYQTQGASQEPLYMKYYNEALAKDPQYAPAYANLFNYYYETNVSKSAEYLDKWLNASDNDPRACFYRASMKYAQGLFKEALTKADECIAAESSNVYPNLYGVKALAYNRLGDSVKAKEFYEKYFQVQTADNIGGGDYSAYAGILLKFPGNEQKAAELVNKAIAMDTLPENKVNYIKKMAQAYDEVKNYKEEANWYRKVLDVKPNFTNVDIFNVGYNYYLASEYDSSIKYFKLYQEKYPDDIMSYYMLGNANAIIDSTGALGSAAPYYTKVIEIGEKDLTKSNAKLRVTNAYKYFIGYYYNVKRDQATALQYAEKALLVAPDDQSLIQLKDIISKNNPGAPAKKPAAAPTAKDSTSKNR